MKRAKLLKYLAALALILLASCECLPPPSRSGKITIASFNIEIFGQAKASKPEVVKILALRNKVNENGAASDNTYDRIVTTLDSEEDFAGSVGVLRFDTAYDFSSPSLEPDDVSDHFPVWAGFYSKKDSD